MRVASDSTVVMARLRPGDTGLGERDDVEVAFDRVRAAVGAEDDRHGTRRRGRRLRAIAQGN